MAKDWKGQSYNEDWHPVDNTGAVIGPKDWQANREWDEANAPGGAWNFSQDVAAANPVGWDQTTRGQQYWNAIRGGAPATPTTGIGGGTGGTGGGTGGGGPTGGGLFDWSGWWNGGQSTPTSGGGRTEGGDAMEVPSWMFPVSTAQGANPREPIRAANTHPYQPPPTGPPDPITGLTPLQGGGYALPDGSITAGPRTPAAGSGMSMPVPPPSGGLIAEGYTPPQGGVTPQGAPQPLGSFVPQVNAPTLGPGYSAPTMTAAPSLGQLGAIPQMTAAPSLGSLGATPTMTAAPSLGQLGAIPQMDAAALLSQLGGTPEIAGAGPLSQFGSDVQSSIGRDLGAPSVNLDDPVVRAQVESNRRNTQRAADRRRAVEAQRAHAGGTLGSGGFDARVGQIIEDQGAADADFESQLIASELANARDRTARAQQLGAGLLSQERQQGLAERLANQQSALTGLGLNNTRDLANQGIQQQAGVANLQAGLTGLGLNNQRDLSNQGLQQQAGLANQQAGLATMGLQNTRDLSNQGMQQQAGLANQQAGLTGLGLQNTRDLANQGVLQQTGLANQQAGLQTAGLNNTRDLAQLQAGLQGQMANQNAGLQQFSNETTRQLGMGNLANQQYGNETTRNLGLNDQMIRRNALLLQQLLGQGDLDLRKLGLTNQDAQFYAGLGQQLGLDTARLNQQALLALLGGG